ncbi:MAG TPA: hypothetical protein VIR81_11890 [Myxococcales bacterium]
MRSILAIALFLALPAAAKQEMQVRDQGAVRAHVWTSAAGLTNAQTSLRALTAMANDATAFDAEHARELLKDAKGDIQLSRTHARHLKAFQTKDSAEHLAKLDIALDGALQCVDRLESPIARGVSPKNDATQADNTMLGGAAQDRGGPPGKGGDVTIASNRGQRGGTRGVQDLRTGIKEAFDRLDEAKKDLDTVASDYDASTKLPTP